MRLTDRYPAMLLAAFLLGPALARAEDVHAVLSAAQKPYEEALQGFREELGREVGTSVLGGGAPRVAGAKVVVAFGGEAAQVAYPDGVTVVACLAPGLSAGA